MAAVNRGSVSAVLGAFALASSALAGAAPRQDGPDEAFVQLKAPLDEPRRFCFDLSGFGDKIEWRDPVQGHTCKEGYEHADMLVVLSAAQAGRLRLPRYDRCVEARDGALYGVACSAAATQAWTLRGDGRLSPATAAGQCVTIGEKSSVAGHPPEVKPPWVSRPVTLAPCAPGLDPRQQWTLAHSKVPIR